MLVRIVHKHIKFHQGNAMYWTEGRIISALSVIKCGDKFLYTFSCIGLKWKYTNICPHTLSLHYLLTDICSTTYVLRDTNNATCYRPGSIRRQVANRFTWFVEGSLQTWKRHCVSCVGNVPFLKPSPRPLLLVCLHGMFIMIILINKILLIIIINFYFWNQIKMYFKIYVNRCWIFIIFKN